MTNNAHELADSTEAEVGRICVEICRITGVQLGDSQRRMVISRLLRRALNLGIPDIDGYIEYYLQNKATETDALTSLLTTHHTYFFREPAHFEYLEMNLVRIVANAKARGAKKIRILSAACSRGHESYTLAMILARHLPLIASDLTYEIVGLDVDPESVAIANNGVYHRNEIKAVPVQYLGDHWMRGTKAVSEYVRANASIKDRCVFIVGNLLTYRQDPAAEKFDVVFCRNVFIYFTPEQTKKVASSLLESLHSQGILFVGLCESLSKSGLPLTSLGPSIYAKEPAPALAAVTSPTKILVAPAQAAPIRVLCVDDSPVILTILRKILCEKSGFYVVATAANGLEAAAVLATTPVDVVTLDIHMPKQDGLAYLRKNFGAGHPPVVMLSSVSRDDADLALHCFEAGASDYVEKPALGDIGERGEEICIKLRCALRAKANQPPKVGALDAAFATKTLIHDVSSKLRIILANFGDRAKLAASLKELSGNQPATIVVIDGAGNPIKGIAKELSASASRLIQAYEGPEQELNDGSVYVCGATDLDGIAQRYRTRTASMLIFGEATVKTVAKLAQFSCRNVLVEMDGGRRTDEHLRRIADDLVPATSFMNMSCFFLAKRGP